MAHPDRAALIPALQQAIGGDVPVVFDEKQNVWDTCRRAWLAHDRAADYSLVIQDDAIVCKDFRKKAIAVLEAQSKEYMTAFYAGGMAKPRVRHALMRGDDHFVSAMIFNEVALCIPTKHIEEMVKFCDDRDAVNDHLIQKWLQLRRIKVWYPVPSLVDHRTDTVSIYRSNLEREDADVPRSAIAFIDTYEKRKR